LNIKLFSTLPPRFHWKIKRFAEEEIFFFREGIQIHEIMSIILPIFPCSLISPRRAVRNSCRPFIICQGQLMQSAPNSASAHAQVHPLKYTITSSAAKLIMLFEISTGSRYLICLDQTILRGRRARRDFFLCSLCSFMTSGVNCFCSG